MSTALRAQSAPDATRLLTRILEEPGLARAIGELAPAELAALVRRVGVEDAGELVALATTDQLVGVFDEELWCNERPGEQESFDKDRFVLWLEVMLEAGDAFVASRLSELPEDLLTLALHEQVLVLEVDGLAERMLDNAEADEVDLLDKALTSCLYEELDEYQLIARHPDGWDAVLAAVLALDRDHGELLRRVLDRCAAMSAEYIDDNGGLYEVLTSEEMLGEDVAGERESRRASAGYVAPSDALSFLKLAAAGGQAKERDPVTRAWFREISGGPAKAPAPRQPSQELRRILHAAGMTPREIPMLMAEGDWSEARGGRKRASASPDQRVVQAMKLLAEQSRTAFDKRQEELAYLANVLVAGATIAGRRVRPVEGIRAALSVVGIGLESDTAGPPTRLTPSEEAATLASVSLDVLFRAGWARLHSEAAAAGRSHASNDLEVLENRQVKRAAKKRRTPPGRTCAH